MQSLSEVQAEIAPLRSALVNHGMYQSIRTLADLQIFMEYHVFAVWDFMWLLKALQGKLTCVTLPWVPRLGVSNSATRLINEIVLGEESDLLADGRCLSHFELYLQAMAQCGADSSSIESVVLQISSGATLEEALNDSPVSNVVREFVETTASFIGTDKTHIIAAAFALGREDLIPDMFTELVRSLDSDLTPTTKLFAEYLERHIEVDSESHGPLAAQLLESLCGSDAAKWNEVSRTAISALTARLRLWDAVCLGIDRSRQSISAATL